MMLKPFLLGPADSKWYPSKTMIQWPMSVLYFMLYKTKTLKCTDKQGKKELKNVCNNVVNTKTGQKGINKTKFFEANIIKNNTRMSESVSYQDISSNTSPCGDQAEVVNPEVTDSTKQTPLLDSSPISTHKAALNTAKISGCTSVTSKTTEQSSALKHTYNPVDHNDLALLYDINDNCVADKFVNTMTSEKVNDILNGKVDVECVVQIREGKWGSEIPQE